MQQTSRVPPYVAARAMTPEEMAALLARSYSYDGRYAGWDRRPLLAVLDTSCVRTGLHFQLRHGEPPATIRAARDGDIRLFMEHDTLVEAADRLLRFAGQFGVSVDELTQIFDQWLPYIRVVRLPAELRCVDPRAIEVQGLDPDDYPAAALASLLSPCVLLTHNVRDFGPLGVLTAEQGVEAVIAGIALRLGESRFQASIMVPAAPFMAVGALTKWASQKIGPWAYVLLGVAVVTGGFAYARQPVERRERIKGFAIDAINVVLKMMSEAAGELGTARMQLRGGIVPGPADRTPGSAMIRELALADESLSAQQLADLLDDSSRPAVPVLRAYLHANDNGLFLQIRRGSFQLGGYFRLTA
jgi:hypothetical protein